jgi:hypothetical protein
MRTHVEFRSAKFPPYDGEEQEVNPGLYGKRLAEYLQRELQKQGIDTGEILAEDWGWIVPLREESFSMWLGCGHYQEYEDGFLCFIEPSKPFIRRWLRRIDVRPAVERVATALDGILRSDSEIRDVQWWKDRAKGV